MEQDLPALDSPFAQSLIGKYVLCGMSFVSPWGEVLDQQQRHGIVTQIVSRRGIRLLLKGRIYDGQEFWLPPDVSAFRPAPSGEYTLASTGEVVTDPDYTCSWIINVPQV